MIDPWKDKHKGEDVYILGSGASLRPLVGEDPPYNFDWLIGKTVIAISHTTNYFDGAQYCVILDPPALKNLKTRPGPTAPFHTFCASTVPNPGKIDVSKNVTVIRTVAEPSQAVHSGLYGAMSTSYVAVNLAWIMGARRIYLLGHDCCAIDGRTHWYDLQATKGYVPAGGGKRYARMINGWAKFKGKAPIVVLGMGSAIELFEKRDLLEHFK
jgi:hypothetical protein